MNYLKNLIIITILLLGIGCTSSKFSVEMPSDNYWKLVLKNKNERVFCVWQQSDTITIGNQEFSKEKGRYNGDKFLVHQNGKKTDVFSQLSSSGYVNVSTIQFSQKGNLYVYGDFSKDITIDSLHTKEIVHSNEREAFILKYDAQFNYQWIKIIRGNKSDFQPFNLVNAPIDSEENIYLHHPISSNRAVIYYENQQIWNKEQPKGKLLFKINKDGKLLWHKFYPEEENESKIIASTLVKDELWVLKRQFTPVSSEDSIMPKGGFLSVIEDEGKINREALVEGFYYPRKIFPIQQEKFILISRDTRRQPKTRNIFAQTPNVHTSKFGLTTEMDCHYVCYVNQKGEYLWNTVGFRSYRGHRSKRLMIDQIATPPFKDKIIGIKKHESRVHRGPTTLYDITLFGMKDGSRETCLLQIQNLIDRGEILVDGKLHIYGYTLNSFLNINGEKVPIKNRKFTKEQKQEEKRLKIKTPLLLTFDLKELEFVPDSIEFFELDQYGHVKE